MKKIIKVLLLIILTVGLCSLNACGDKDTGTYIPTRDEMITNLGKDGYGICKITSIMLVSGGCITNFSTEKGDEYIDFYWLKTPEQCDSYYDELNERHPDCEIIVKIVNDKKYGCIIFCGTQAAIDAAGIKIGEIKVDVGC